VVLVRYLEVHYNEELVVKVCSARIAIDCRQCSPW
jgi:hypothetical protein